MVDVFVWVCPGVGDVVICIVSYDAWKIWSGTNMAVCLITSTYCYTRIFITLRRQQTQVHNSSRGQENQAIALNIRWCRCKSTRKLAFNTFIRANQSIELFSKIGTLSQLSNVETLGLSNMY